MLRDEAKADAEENRQRIEAVNNLLKDAIAKRQADALMTQEEFAKVSQRTRWEHGHLSTALTQVPRLLLSGILCAPGSRWLLLLSAPGTPLLLCIPASGLLLLSAPGSRLLLLLLPPLAPDDWTGG